MRRILTVGMLQASWILIASRMMWSSGEGSNLGQQFTKLPLCPLSYQSPRGADQSNPSIDSTRIFTRCARLRRSKACDNIPLTGVGALSALMSFAS